MNALNVVTERCRTGPGNALDGHILLHRNNIAVFSADGRIQVHSNGDLPRSATEGFPMTDTSVVQEKMKAIATAYTDYTKSAFEANKAYMEKLATIKDP